MAAPELFSDLLAKKLAWEAQQTSSAPSGSVRTRPFEPELWGFTAATGLAGHARSLFQNHFQNHRQDQATDGTPVTSQPVRTLASSEKKALYVMRDLGASLNDDFDASSLKRAFRKLALVLHPDRHPGASHRTRRQLSARFSALCAAYKTLAS